MTSPGNSALRFLPLAALLWLTLPPPACAATRPVPELPVASALNDVAMQWQGGTPGTSRLVAGTLAVPVYLDTTAWRGRPARVYLVLPPQPMGRIDVRWRTSGPLLAGQLVAGQRGLIYAGLVPASLRDTLVFDIVADGTRLQRTQALAFRFEIDLE